MSSSSSEAEVDALFPVKYVDRKSMHRKYLFDVDGYIVRGVHDEPLNLYHPALKEYINTGYVTFIYDVHREYRYIVRSKIQHDRFKRERVIGSSRPNRMYHIYPDDDSTTVPLLQPKPRRPPPPRTS